MSRQKREINEMRNRLALNASELMGNYDDASEEVDAIEEAKLNEHESWAMSKGMRWGAISLLVLAILAALAAAWSLM